MSETKRPKRMAVIMMTTAAMATPVRIAIIAQFLAYFETVRAPERCPTSQAKSTYIMLCVMQVTKLILSQT